MWRVVETGRESRGEDECCLVILSAWELASMSSSTASALRVGL